MRAFILTAPRQAEVRQIPEPVAAPGEVVVDVERVGVCGTDVEFYTGEMQYLHDGHASYPMLLGHEWMGRVREVGAGVDPGWIGRRVTADTMLGCQQCSRCDQGLQHVCANRTEIGVRGGRPGALAERIAVPAWSLHALPDSIDDTVGALIEPGGNALRSLEASQARVGDRLLVIGPGTIGLLVAMLARARGVDVHLLGSSQRSLDFAAAIGFEQGWTSQTLPDVEFDAVVDASNDPGSPARAIDLVTPGKRVVYIGIAGVPSAVDARRLVFGDVTAVGILSASPGMARVIDHFAKGEVDPRPLVAETISLDGLADVLDGRRPPGAGPGPKIHIDPRAGG